MNKDEILAVTGGGIHVFRHYIKGNWKVNKKFLNPLYHDTKPSCCIYFDRKTGEYRMKDFGNLDYSGDCIAVAGFTKGLDSNKPKEFKEIMLRIDEDMSLGLANRGEPSDTQWRPNRTPKRSKTKPTTVTVIDKAPETLEEEIKVPKHYELITREFSSADMLFWGAYGITKEVLSRYNVSAVAYFSSISKDGKPFRIAHKDNEPVYSYDVDGYVKVYRPYSSLRFLYGGETPDEYCFGLDQLPNRGDILFITGGEKDVMSLAAKGFNAICFNSESAVISEAMIERLSFMFRHIVFMYDMDKTGIAQSFRCVNQFTEYNAKRLLLPISGAKNDKDISDFFRSGGTAEELRRLFVEMLRSLYRNSISMLRSCTIDFNNPPPEAELIISINNIPLGAKGDLLCVTGGEGTGKSNFIGAIVSGTINNQESDIDTLGIYVKPNIDNKAILVYDTEQSKFQLYKNGCNILRRTEIPQPPRTLKLYSMTAMSRSARLKHLIEDIDMSFYLYGGIHMIIIDGIADLIHSVNDENNSIAIVEELYRLAELYDTCIVCVLHLTPSGVKLRGHLGSELKRKAAAVVSIEKDDDCKNSIIKALKIRDGSPLDAPIIQFAWSKEHEMFRYVGEKPKEDKEMRKERELSSAAKEIYSHVSHLTYNELCAEMQNYFDVKERAAKGYIRYMRERDIIVADPSDSTYLMLGLFNQ